MNKLKNDKLLNLLRSDALLFNSPVHGLYHWRTVERNGLYLSSFNKADKKVVSLFAYFHDCMRENEGMDIKHGPRASDYIKLHKDILEISKDQLKILCMACAGHTVGTKTNCVTVSTCWDADRLDLGRVGIIPDAKYLFTNEAKRIADERDHKILYEFSEVEKM
ncbi:MAG: hypothetical protein COA79_09525 [Planctomycetota bacterium]|nr:MAG: hypothetical protein COA79_09525 [Planctomycetota bacterium]